MRIDAHRLQEVLETGRGGPLQAERALAVIESMCLEAARREADLPQWGGERRPCAGLTIKGVEAPTQWANAAGPTVAAASVSGFQNMLFSGPGDGLLLGISGSVRSTDGLTADLTTTLVEVSVNGGRDLMTDQNGPARVSYADIFTATGFYMPLRRFLRATDTLQLRWQNIDTAAAIVPSLTFWYVAKRDCSRDEWHVMTGEQAPGIDAAALGELVKGAQHKGPMVAQRTLTDIEAACSEVASSMGLPKVWQAVERCPGYALRGIESPTRLLRVDAPLLPTPGFTSAPQVFRFRGPADGVLVGIKGSSRRTVANTPGQLENLSVQIAAGGRGDQTNFLTDGQQPAFVPYADLFRNGDGYTPVRRFFQAREYLSVLYRSNLGVGIINPELQPSLTLFYLSKRDCYLDDVLLGEG